MGAVLTKLLRWVASWLLAVTMLTIRATCRIRLHDDPRPTVRRAGEPYAYAILHAHQVSAIMAAEAGTCAMVSRSADGGLIVPMLRIRRVIPVRGSSRRSNHVDRGGGAALALMMDHIRGGRPGYIAVDGPRGPRGVVHGGIARLAGDIGAAVVVAVAVPSRRWIITGAWDRMQIPWPFSVIDIHFGPVLRREPGEDEATFCASVAAMIAELELRHDPVEARPGAEAAARSRGRSARDAPHPDEQTYASM